MALMIMIMIMKRIPLVISTIFEYYTRGPTLPSWGLKIHLTFKLLSSFASTSYEPLRTIEEIQAFDFLKNYNIPYVKIDKIFISHKYRINAQEYIEKLIKPYAIAIDPIWKSPKSDGINCELVMDKNYNEESDWEKEKIVIYLHGGAYIAGNLNHCRDLVCKLSKASGARLLSVETRLAPQQPFPAALCDALATYLYLTDPPNDSGLKPYKPEQIVICGESSGGGLAISTGLALRDLGLPSPAGIVALGPWLDLTHSMPSFIENELDSLQKVPGFIKVDPNSVTYNEFKARSEIITRNIQQQPEIKLIGDESLKRIGRPINMYVCNEGLAIPYASPIFAESLGGLPPMLIVSGNLDRLRDESIYLSYRAANPEKYRLPAYEIDFDNSRFKTPTKVTLELYDEMFHGFQLLPFGDQSKTSIQRAGDFISSVIQETTLGDSPSHEINALRISPHGEARTLDESSIERILRWDKVGVFPSV